MTLPNAFEERMRAMLGAGYEDFCAAFTGGETYSGIRVNILKKGAKEAIEKEFGTMEQVDWCAEGYYADKSVISGSHPYHLAGLFYFQEPSAMCAAAALPIEAGDRVLDLCAAPGGKSTQAAAKLGGTGLLVANEIVGSRAQILSSNIERMGVRNAVVTNESPDSLAKVFPGYFDKMLVDAPCSGEGMFRKEPRAVTEWSVEHTVSCGERQKNILSSALEMLRPGGMLVYSTCTFAPEENEKIAAWLIEQGMEICPMPELSMLSSAVSEWGGGADVSAARRIYPHLHRGEGHFAALFRKRGDGERREQKIKKAAKAASPEDAVKLYRRLEKDILKAPLEGKIMLFGEGLYLVSEGIDVSGLRVLRCGLRLGTVKKNRIEPSHALALAMSADELKSRVELAPGDERLMRYLRGEVIECDAKGWCAVCVNGYPIGWGKASGGVLKNHFPKGLRAMRNS